MSTTPLPESPGAEPAPPPSPSVARTRNAIFDGIRGLAILLVILHHGWALWPTDGVVSEDWARPIFFSGNFGVSVFFVVGAFLATRALMRLSASDAELHPGVVLVRRYLRLSGQLWALLLAVLVVTAVDDVYAFPGTETGESAWRVLTYTFNWYLADQAFVARPDLGHLWYLSVDLQVFIIVLVLVYLLGRRTRWLLVCLVALFVLAVIWRDHVVDSEEIYHAMLRTWARMDAPLAGAIAAVALPYTTRLGRYAKPALVLSALALVPMLVLTDSESSYMGWAGVALSIVLAVFVSTASLVRTPSVALRRTLGNGPLAFLGRRSLGLYLWHYPVFWWLSRHTTDWHWEARTVVGLLLAFSLSEASQRLVERRVQRHLESPAWRRLDHGFIAYASTTLRTRWQEYLHEETGPTDRSGTA